MKSFKSFLAEELKKGHYSFLHPHKGMYKLTKHNDDNVYHLHNKFGEVSHTFSGHMTPKEVAQALKHDHDMILVDKLHEELLNELKKPELTDHEKALESESKKVSKEMNPHRGGYNETSLAKHLNGGKFIDSEHKSSHEHHKKQLQHYDKTYGKNEVKTQDDRSKEQAHVFLKHAKEKGYDKIKHVHLVSKPGDIEKKTGIKATQQENPSDISVEFHKKPVVAKHGHLGISAKSSKAKSIGFHNGGTKETGNFLTKHLGGSK